MWFYFFYFMNECKIILKCFCLKEKSITEKYINVVNWNAKKVKNFFNLKLIKQYLQKVSLIVYCTIVIYI